MYEITYTEKLGLIICIYVLRGHVRRKITHSCHCSGHFSRLSFNWAINAGANNCILQEGADSIDASLPWQPNLKRFPPQRTASSTEKTKHFRRTNILAPRPRLRLQQQDNCPFPTLSTTIDKSVQSIQFVKQRIIHLYKCIV
jgi:hypothetical protein